MRPEIAKYLHDVRQACLLLETFTSGKSLTDYSADNQVEAMLAPSSAPQDRRSTFLYFVGPPLALGTLCL